MLRWESDAILALHCTRCGAICITMATSFWLCGEIQPHLGVFTHSGPKADLRRKGMPVLKWPSERRKSSSGHPQRRGKCSFFFSIRRCQVGLAQRHTGAPPCPVSTFNQNKTTTTKTLNCKSASLNGPKNVRGTSKWSTEGGRARLRHECPINPLVMR